MNIVVLVGGYSNERNVSLSSGAMIARALRENGHCVAVVDSLLGVDSDVTLEELYKKEIPNEWLTAAAEPVNLQEVLKMTQSNALIGPNVLKLSLAADAVFLALHGGCGEDGRIQAILDCYGIKYTGTDYLSSGIAMNKDVAKGIARDFGVKTPDWKILSEVKSDEIEKLAAENTQYPAVIKIPNSGSSVGVYIVKNAQEFKAALKDNIGKRVIIEQYIKGREIQMAFLKNRALPSIEIVPLSEFYTYDNKYVKGGAKEVSPADIPKATEHKMADMLLRVVHALGITDYARADFIIDEKNEIWFIEINTLPGMTATSLLPQEAAAAGINFHELCETVLQLALHKKVGIQKECK